MKYKDRREVFYIMSHMKHLLIIFSLLLTSVSWSKDVNYMDLVIRNGLHYEKFTDELFTGKVVGFEKGYKGR